MTIKTQIASERFSDAIYLIESLIDVKADESDLRTALMLLHDYNLNEDEMNFLHNKVNNQIK